MVTSTAAKTTPSSRNTPARGSPGARILATISLLSSSLARDLYKVIGQGLDLLRLEGLLVVGRHDAVLEALLDVGAGILDRLPDERRVALLEHLVEVGPDRPVGARVRERVTGGALGLDAREQRLAVGRLAAGDR